MEFAIKIWLIGTENVTLKISLTHKLQKWLKKRKRRPQRILQHQRKNQQQLQNVITKSLFVNLIQAPKPQVAVKSTTPPVSLNPSTPNQDLIEKARLEKLKGNQDYDKGMNFTHLSSSHSGNYASAVNRYTKAIALAGKNTSLLLSIFTNRAITLLKLRVHTSLFVILIF